VSELAMSLSVGRGPVSELFILFTVG